LQLGVAAAFDAEDGNLDGVPELFEGNFQRLAAALEAAGIDVCPAQGGYFLLADVAKTGYCYIESMRVGVSQSKLLCGIQQQE
jgi:hypothetical protein